jgi:MerR family regulatory protein
LPVVVGGVHERAARLDETVQDTNGGALVGPVPEVHDAQADVADGAHYRCQAGGMSAYTPAQVVQETGLSIETLRYCERIGLLEPVGRNAAGEHTIDERIALLELSQSSPRFSISGWRASSGLLRGMEFRASSR